MSSSIGEEAVQSETAARIHGQTPADQLTVWILLSALVRIAFTTACYWFVGITPEDNHGIKGYRVALSKVLEVHEDSWARASLAWCYVQLGLTESGVEHYRLAYARNKNPEIAVFLAYAEADFGNVGAARRLQAEASARRDELSSEAQAQLSELENRLRARSSGRFESM